MASVAFLLLLGGAGFFGPLAFGFLGFLADFADLLEFPFRRRNDFSFGGGGASDRVVDWVLQSLWGVRLDVCCWGKDGNVVRRIPRYSTQQYHQI